MTDVLRPLASNLVIMPALSGWPFTLMSNSWPSGVSQAGEWSGKGGYCLFAYSLTNWTFPNYYISILIGMQMEAFELSVRDQVMTAVEKILKTKPYDQITFSEIAKEAGVHWTSVRRHFGGKLQMREWLRAKQAEESHFADTRTRILEAAQRMFAELGFANASLDKVASDAGMTKGAVYWHFSSKHDLFLALLEHSLQQQLRQLPAQIEQLFMSNDPEVSLAELLQAQLDCLEQESGGSMLFLEFITSSRDPEIRAKLREVHGRIIDGVSAMIKEMQQKGKISAHLDPNAISLAIDALLKGYVIEWLIDPARCESKVLFQSIARLLWKGLDPRE